MSSASLWWRHLVKACEVEAHLIGLLSRLSAVCFWQTRESLLNVFLNGIVPLDGVDATQSAVIAFKICLSRLED